VPYQRFNVARKRFEREDPAGRASQLSKQQRIKARVRTHVPADHSRTDRPDNPPLLRSFIRTQPATMVGRSGDPALAAQGTLQDADLRVSRDEPKGQAQHSTDELGVRDTGKVNHSGRRLPNSVCSIFPKLAIGGTSPPRQL